MKKILICFLAVMALSNCEVKFKEVKAQINPNQKELVSIGTGVSDGMPYHFEIRRLEIDSMEYAVFTYYGDAIYSINLTKEKLEIELLRKQLKTKSK
jgi:hypothetical protein